ncbi:MAG: hypothetical protein HQK82_11020, partial [Desulfovibrionaceae bacterium]|nr:hypothetical protein [Desulfovibrionaceae bacterium]
MQLLSPEGDFKVEGAGAAMEIIPLYSLGKLPKDCSVLIYGAGGRGDRLLTLIRKFRSDLQFSGFIDTYKSGIKDGIQIFNVQSLDKLLNANKNIIIIIASNFAHQIYCELSKLRPLRNFRDLLSFLSLTG